MSITYISLDLETTGLDPQRDAIIEIGAVRFQGEQILETFETFVNPGRTVPPFITELTGITNADVRGAPGARQATLKLQDFVGHDPVIGHNISFDLSFLNQHGVLARNLAIDTFELASILVPHAGRYTLQNLVHELGITLSAQTHRALDDARMTHGLFVALLERAVQLPQATLEEIVQLGQRHRWGPAQFFREALRQRGRHSFSGGIGAQLAAALGGDAAQPLFLKERLPEPLTPREEPALLDLDALTRLLDEDSPFAAAFPEYESRDQQLEMLQAVGEAFNGGYHLMVEAGTGTGKSLAYLLPALYWAVQNDERVVISTNTINLQEQLLDKDLPLLSKTLPFKFRAALLKGRSHYLCRRQFQALRQRGPAQNHEARVVAKILLWLPNTLDGDGDTLFLPTGQEQAVWHTLSAARENCNAHNCPYYLGDECFFYRARDRAEGVHLLIVNHALLLADIAAQHRVLPEHNLLIIDEAHHLERATTEALHFQVDRASVQRLFDDLVRGRRNHPSLLEVLRDAAAQLPRKRSAILLDALLRLEDEAETASQRLEDLFDTFEFFLKENGDMQNAYAARVRLTPMMREQLSWTSVEGTWSAVAPALSQLVDSMNRLDEGLNELSASEAPELLDYQARVEGIMQWLATAYDNLKELIARPSDGGIYWVEEVRRRGYTDLSVHAAPLHVGPLVRKYLLEKLRTVIMTSATLRVEGSFDYLRERLSADDVAELAVGSPFDYPSAALLTVANDLPEPGKPGYQQAIDRALIALLKATEGRALVLFTAYSQLKVTAQAITGPLAAEDILVYAQGSGSSRAQLLDNFRKGERTVLLGTRSFWEGVDVPGEALSCLVIVKLPFDVPDDPVVAARAETYDNPFNQYMVPEAILRFLQGFGRLIRTYTDQGVVVVLDRRVISKRYGARFLNSLPDPTVRVASWKQLPEMAACWLAGKPLPAHAYATDGYEPWDMPPPEEPPWDY